MVGQKHIGRRKSTPVIGQNLNTASRETLYQNVCVIVNILENVIVERGQCEYFLLLNVTFKTKLKLSSYYFQLIPVIAS